MKKLLCILFASLILFPLMASADAVVQMKLTASFWDNQREGLYTGDLNETGNPEGFGVFEGVNDLGLRYYMIGQWIDGHFTGSGGWRVFADGTLMIGTFDNGMLINGNLFMPSTPNHVKRESQ